MKMKKSIINIELDSHEEIIAYNGGTAQAGTCRYCGAPLEVDNPGRICWDCKKKYTDANRNS